MDQNNKTVELSQKKPLIATLEITSSAQAYFNQLRQQHFPAERNFIDAHLTLFHALPDEPWIVGDVADLAKHYRPFEATVQSVVSLGFGTAFKVTSPELPVIYQKLQQKWVDSLTSQDRQKRNFHITIQNKVAPLEAKNLQAAMSQHFTPFNFTVLGIQLWRYMGGPWEFHSRFTFNSDIIP